MADFGVAEYAAIASILGGVGTVANAFKGSPSSPAPPALTTPTVMPIPDDQAAKDAKRKQLSALSQRRGRQSTILSDTTTADLLGG